MAAVEPVELRKAEHQTTQHPAIVSLVNLLSAALNVSLFVTSAQSDNLTDIVRDHWELHARYEPVRASARGDRRFSRDWPQMILQRYASELDDLKAIRNRLERIKVAHEADVINKDLLLREVKARIKEIALGSPLMDSDHEEGEQLMPQRSVALLRFSDLRDYEDYVVRLENLPRYLGQLEALFSEGRRRGLIPPRRILGLAAEQCEAVAATLPEDSVFAEPLSRFPESISPEERVDIRSKVLRAIKTIVQPAYRRLGSFYKEDYAPYGNEHPGLWRLPSGGKMYSRALRFWTTTNLSADEIHKIGTQEVTRISVLMRANSSKLGFRSLEECRDALTQQPRYRAKSADQLLALAKQYTDGIRSLLPKLFLNASTTKLEVRAIPAEHLASDIGYYDPPSADGGRPGIYWVGASNFANIPLFSFEAITYHEGLPGHHMQFALAQDLTNLPEFRRAAEYGAFVEGWALYAERLAKELGMYKDPLSDMGRLSQEMVRACRMVVDTGVHSKGWSRQQIVAYLRKHTFLSDTNIESEADRYIAWPGQCVSYKVGELHLLRLREESRKRLGKRFDIRKFHHQVLGAGAIPLDALSRRIESWIRSQQ